MSLYLPSLLKQKEVSLAQALACIATSIASFGLYRLVQRYVAWLTCPLNQLPGPAANRSSFLLGVFPEINRQPFLAPHKKWIADAGKDVKLIYYTTIFGRANLLVVDKEITKEILTAPAGKDDYRFRKQIASIQNIVGDGLVTLDGPAWMRHRRIVRPAFSASILRNALQATVPEKVNELIGYWKMAANREIDASSHLSALTLDIIGPVAFSHQCHGLEAIQAWAQSQTDKKPEINDPFLSSIAKAFQFDFLTIALFSLHFYSLDGWRTSRRTVRRFLNAETDKIVAAAASNLAQHNKTKSVLSALIEAQENDSESTERLTTEELRDEVKMCECVMSGLVRL